MSCALVSALHDQARERFRLRPRYTITPAAAMPERTRDVGSGTEAPLNAAAPSIPPITDWS